MADVVITRYPIDLYLSINASVDASPTSHLFMHKMTGISACSIITNILSSNNSLMSGL